MNTEQEIIQKDASRPVAEANEQDVSEKLIDVARAVHRPDFSPTWQAARMAAEKCFAPNKEQGIVDAFSSG